MKCKYCQAELEDDASVCPCCGELQTEHTEDQPGREAGQPEKASSRSNTLLMILGILVLIAAVAVVVITLNSQTQTAQPTDPEQSLNTTVLPDDPTGTTQATEPAMTAADFLMHEDIADRASYAADTDALAAAAEQVVATAGEFSLDNELLQLFYWTQFNEFMNEYGTYAYYLYGLDDTAPLDSQTISGVAVTWEQYFLDSGLTLWYQCALLNTLAKEAGFTLGEDMVQVLDDMLVELDADALENGYADADALVADAIGPGCTAQGYYDYMVFYWTAMYYYVELVESFEPAYDEVKAYYDAHTEEFEASGITEESYPYVDVRHILIMPKGGTTDVSGTTTYSDAEWETCYNEAKAILDAWAAGEATEDSFAALANEHSEDGGSNTTGGLYEDVTDDGTYAEEFTGWCMEEGRAAGDTGIVQTTYGYHIMYCSDVKQAWYVYALDSVIYDLYNDAMEACEAECVLEYDLDAMVLGRIAVQQTEQETGQETTAPTE